MIVRLIQILIAITVVVICFLATLWVLGMLGLAVPVDLLRAIFVLIALVAVLGAIQGRWDNWWRPPRA